MILISERKDSNQFDSISRVVEIFVRKGQTPNLFLDNSQGLLVYLVDVFKIQIKNGLL